MSENGIDSENMSSRRDCPRVAIRDRGPARYGSERATIQPGEQHG
jgi:hypothetical protein